MASLTPKERAILLSRHGRSNEEVAAILGVDLTDVQALMLQADPNVELPGGGDGEVAASIWVQWSQGGPVASGSQRGIAMLEMYEPFTSDPPDPEVFGSAAYGGGQTLLEPTEDQVPTLVEPGLYLITTAVFMSSTGLVDDAKQGNRIEHILGGGGEIDQVGEHWFHAFTATSFTDHVLVKDGPTTLYLRYVNLCGAAQEISSASSIVSRIASV